MRGDIGHPPDGQGFVRGLDRTCRYQRDPVRCTPIQLPQRSSRLVGDRRSVPRPQVGGPQPLGPCLRRGSMPVDPRQHPDQYPVLDPPMELLVRESTFDQLSAGHHSSLLPSQAQQRCVGAFVVRKRPLSGIHRTKKAGKPRGACGGGLRRPLGGAGGRAEGANLPLSGKRLAQNDQRGHLR